MKLNLVLIILKLLQEVGFYFSSVELFKKEKFK